MYWLILTLLLYRTHAYPCGQCMCKEQQNILSCSGYNVYALPLLNETEWIHHVDVINTSITKMGLLSTYENLYSADIRFNPAQGCPSLETLRAAVHLTSDCHDDPPVQTKAAVITDQPKDWMNLLAITPSIFILVLILYLKNKFNHVMKQYIDRPCYAEKQPLSGSTHCSEETIL